MKKQKHYYWIFFLIFIFCILFQGITNLISGHEFLTVNDLIHDILPYMIFIGFIIFVANLYGKKEN